MDEQKDQDIQDQEFERYGVWVKAGPEEVLEADDDFSMTDLSSGIDDLEDLGDGIEDDDLVSLDDFDIPEPQEESDPFQALGADLDEDTTEDDDFDLESLSGSLEDDYDNLGLDDDGEESFDEAMTMPGSDEEIEEISLEDIDEDDSVEDLPELDADQDEHDFTPEDQGIEIVPESTGNTLSPDEEEFLREDADETADLQNTAESAIPSSMDSQEREAFERIQNELSDIKRELAELKAVLKEGSSYSRGPAAWEPSQEEPSSDEEPALEPSGMETPAEEETGETEASPGTGFFEDEEDETIALTGDELDNILNTAEFTEEAGEAEELDDDFLMPDADDGEEESTGDAEDEFSTTERDEEESLTDEETVADEEPVTEISLDEDSGAPFVLEGDDSAVDELADMDIDQELAGIESLTDDTEAEADEILDDMELDIDALEDETAETEEEPLHTVPGNDDDLELDLDDLEDFDDLDVTTEEIEVGDDDLDTPQAETAPAHEEESLDDDEGFDDFAAAVEQDLEEPPADELSPEDDFGGEIELDLEDEEQPEEPLLDDEAPVLGEQEPTLELPEEEPAPGDELPEEEITDEEPSPIPAEEFGGDEEPLSMEEFGGEEEPLSMEEFGGEELADEEPETPRAASIADLPEDLKQEIRSVLSYMDQLLEALPDDKIEEFAQSEHFEVYKHLFEELGLET